MAMCRILKEKGYRVAPFKAMNMSLNSISTEKGEEISRAQWLQAKAAGIEADWRMNPILLKPEGMGASQVISCGKSLGKMTISEYGDFLRNRGKESVREALSSLLDEYDFVVGEGSGSCAEINLYDRDISNTWLTEEFKGTGILVTNIENGGSFASLYGTKRLAQYPDTIRYFVINNMRGNSQMLSKGIDFIEADTGMKCLGIIPHIEHNLPGEDSLDYSNAGHGKISVVKYPFFENYSDLDYLRAIGNCKYVVKPDDIDDADWIILPGSKNVKEDMEYLKKTGLWERIIGFMASGGNILGICGGFQILSKNIDFKDGNGKRKGMGFLDVDFEYSQRKTVKRVEYEGELNGNKFRGKGYEIRFGYVSRRACKNFIMADGSEEGAISPDGRIIGTNIHGILENREFLNNVLGIPVEEDYSAILNRDLDNFSHTVSANLKTSVLSQIINEY